MRVIDTRTGGYETARERQEATGERIADKAEPTDTDEQIAARAEELARTLDN